MTTMPIPPRPAFRLRPGLFLVLTTLLILTTVLVRAQEQPLKMATVDMQGLFKNYHRTNKFQEQFDTERSKIQRNNHRRLVMIQNLEQEMQALRGQLENPPIDEKSQMQLFEEFQAKTLEHVQMDQERKEFLNRRTENLNRIMGVRMQEILKEIRAKVESHARSNGYNYVVDRSARGSTQIPFLIYSEIDDLTAQLLAELNGNAPVDLQIAGQPAGATEPEK